MLRLTSRRLLSQNTLRRHFTDFTQPSLKKGDVKLAAWNVCGMGSILKKGTFEDYLARENPDVVCLSEVRMDEHLVPRFAGYHSFFNSSRVRKGQSGVGLLTKTEPISVTKGIGIDEYDTDGRVITAEYDHYYIVSSYVPQAGSRDPKTGWPDKLAYRLQWDKAMHQYLIQLEKKKPIIWAGDLNVAHQKIDISSTRGKFRDRAAGWTEAERDSFSSFLSLGFVDVYRKLHPKAEGHYTFWPNYGDAREMSKGWRLDYFIVSPILAPLVSEAYFRPFVFGSDHCPIAIHLNQISGQILPAQS